MDEKISAAAFERAVEEVAEATRRVLGGVARIETEINKIMDAMENFPHTYLFRQQDTAALRVAETAK